MLNWIKNNFQGRMGGKAHLLIIISVCITVGLSLASSLTSERKFTQKILEELIPERKQLNYKKLAENLLTDLKNFDTAWKRNYIESYITDKSPDQIMSILLNLYIFKDKYTAGPIAEMLSIAAYNRYKSKNIILKLSLEYMKGISVEKNFVKSIAILDLPVFETDSLASFYRGIWWSDKTNPSYNLENAMLHLNFAEKNGLLYARKLINRIENDQ